LVDAAELVLLVCPGDLEGLLGQVLEGGGDQVDQFVVVDARISTLPFSSYSFWGQTSRRRLEAESEPGR
jgi:hypothetical protein